MLIIVFIYSLFVEYSTFDDRKSLSNNFGPVRSSIYATLSFAASSNTSFVIRFNAYY